MKKSSFDRNAFMKNLEKKAREVYADSRKLMKDGMQGLEVLANKTMEVGRLKIENQRALNQIRSLFTDIGQRVYDAVVNQTQQAIKVTPEINLFIDQVKKLQRHIEKNLTNLRHVTLSAVNSAKGGKKAKAAKAVKRAAPKRKAAAAPKKKAKKKK